MAGKRAPSAANKPIVDLADRKAKSGDNYQELVQVIDKDGSIVNEAAFAQYTKDELVQFMELLVWERNLHEQTMVFSRQGRLGFYAPTWGQEASQMGSIKAFDKQDFIFPGYRDVPQLIQHGAITVAQAYLWSRGHVQGNIFPEGVRGWFPQIIIGAQYVEAAGAALGIKKNGEKQVAVAWTGDGGSSEGDFYEAVNFASAFQAPLIAYVQNNGWAISTPAYKQTAAKTLAQKAEAMGVPGVRVDGMDVLAVNAVSRLARQFAIDGNGPVLIETDVYRYGPHSSAGDDPHRYRTKEDEDPWLKADPLIRLRKVLIERELWSDEREEELAEQNKAAFRDALAEADKTPDQKISELLKNTFEVPTPAVAQQIAYFEQKEAE